VVRVLPHALGHDERLLWIDAPKHLDAHALRIQEAVLFYGVVGVGAAHGIALLLQGSGELSFHSLLGGPALLVGGQAEVTAGEEEDFFLRVCHE
jgi:hypothetical protein